MVGLALSLLLTLEVVLEVVLEGMLGAEVTPLVSVEASESDVEACRDTREPIVEYEVTSACDNPSKTVVWASSLADI